MNKIRLVIVDDHPLIRTGIKSFLNTFDDISVTEDFGDGYEALDFLKDNEIDIILVDLSMPNISGLDLIKKIKNLNKNINILLFSHLDDEHSVKQGMALGASGYLVKDAPEEELLAAIRAISQGGSYLGKNIYHKAFSDSKDYSNMDELTEREEEVLFLVAKGYTNRQISEELLIGETTVKTHVSNILTKLNVESRTQAALIAIRKE